MRVGRCATKVRDGIPCGLIEASSTLHPLWPCRSSNRADRQFTQRCCVPGSSAAHPSKRHPLDLASRRLSPYRSRASPRRKLPGIRHTIIRYRAQSQADHNSFTAIALCVCHERSETLQKACSKKVKIFKTCRYLAIPPQFGYRGQGYEKRQRSERTFRIRNSVTKYAFLAPVIARRFCNGPLISQYFHRPVTLSDRRPGGRQGAFATKGRARIMVPILSTERGRVGYD